MNITPQYHVSIVERSDPAGEVWGYRAFADMPEQRSAVFASVRSGDATVVLNVLHLPTGENRQLRVETGLASASGVYCHVHPLGQGRALVWATLTGATVNHLALFVLDASGPTLAAHGLTSRPMLTPRLLWRSVGLHDVGSGQLVVVDVAYPATEGYGLQQLRAMTLLVRLASGTLQADDWLPGVTVTRPAFADNDGTRLSLFTPGGWVDQPRQLTSLDNRLTFDFDGVTMTGVREQEYRSPDPRDPLAPVAERGAAVGGVLTLIEGQGQALS